MKTHIAKSKLSWQSAAHRRRSPATNATVVNTSPVQTEQEEQSDLEVRAEKPWGAMTGNVSTSSAGKSLTISNGLVVQRKMTLGSVGDRYEQEADRVARQVVSQMNTPGIGEPLSNSQSAPKENAVATQLQAQRPMLQLQGESTGSSVSPDVASAISSAKGTGKPLEPGLQQKMGQALGADFSKVHVHTDARSDQLNRSIQAKAFTTGQDVFFRRGAYNPNSKSGQELIAHELTHVMQQGNQSTTLQRMKFTTDDEITYEEGGFEEGLNADALTVTSYSGGIKYNLNVTAEKENDDTDISDEWIVGFMQLGKGESFRAKWKSDPKAANQKSYIGEHQSNGWLLDSQQENTLFDNPSTIAHGQTVNITGQDKGPSSVVSTTYNKEEDGETTKLDLVSFREKDKFLTYAVAYNKTQDKLEPLKLLKWEADMGAENPGKIPARGAMSIGVELSDDDAGWEELDGVGVDVTENTDAKEISNYDQNLFAIKWGEELREKGFL